MKQKTKQILIGVIIGMVAGPAILAKLKIGQ
jgi:hypothetical protein